MTSGRWGSYAKSSDGVFVSKDEWASAGIVFSITGVAEREGTAQYPKPEWELTVEADDAEETILTFTQGTGGRDDAIRAIAADLRAGVITEVGPLVIVKTRTKSGNTFYALNDAPGSSTTTQDAPPASATPVPVSVPVPAEMP